MVNIKNFIISDNKAHVFIENFRSFDMYIQEIANCSFPSITVKKNVTFKNDQNWHILKIMIFNEEYNGKTIININIDAK